MPRFIFLLLFLVLITGFSTPSRAAEACSFCPPNYCENAALAGQLKAAKKSAAELKGLPPRLSVLFDQLGNCQACVETAPDWPHLVVVHDGAALSDYYGEEVISYTSSRAWSAADEYRARQDMTAGLVSQFHITLGSQPCHCCNANNVEEYRDWISGNSYESLLSDPKWNDDLRTHQSQTVSVTTIDQVHTLPDDLANIPPNLRLQEPMPGKLTEFQTAAPVRVVQVLCQTCQPLADRYNEVGRDINKINTSLASIQRDLSYEQNIADYSRRVADSLNGVAPTPQVLSRQKQHSERMKQAFERVEALQVQLKELTTKLDQQRSARAAIMAELRECEASQCLPKEVDAPNIAFPTVSIIVPPSDAPQTTTQPADINWPDDTAQQTQATPPIDLPPLEIYSIGEILFGHPINGDCPAKAGSVHITSNNGHPLSVADIDEDGKIAEFLDHTIGGNNTPNPTISAEYNCGSKRPKKLKGTLSATVTDTVTGESTELSVVATGQVTKPPKFSDKPNTEFSIKNGFVSGPNWKPVASKCPPCTKLVAQYNDTMQQVFNARRSIQVARHKLKNFRSLNKLDWNTSKPSTVAWLLKFIEGHEKLLENEKALLLKLEQQASYLQSVIRDCERQQCSKKEYTKLPAIEVAGVAKGQFFQPNTAAILSEYEFPWSGPYTTDCLPCKPIVEQLNAVPGWLTRIHHKLAWAEHELNAWELQAQFDGSSAFEDDSQRRIPAIKQKIADLHSETAALKTLMRELQAELSLCQKKYCGKDSNGNPRIAMPSAILEGGALLIDNYSQCEAEPQDTPVNVGPNNEVGSSANFKEKAKGKVVGAAVNALAGLVGLGGGGSKASDGPSTYKDPIKKRAKVKVKSKKPKRELRVGAGFTDQGLLVSSDIRKTPGKGTFQSMVLQNERGWQLWPISLYMYEIWGEWKLSVSWTRDTYVDNELVKHEEGGWNESWKELIAKGEHVNYVEVQRAPLWEQLGFNTATSGARSMGTLFPVSPAMLANEPLDLFIHITDPKQDPVVTVPYHFRLGLDDRGRVTTEHIPTDQSSTNTSKPRGCENFAIAPITPNSGEVLGPSVATDANDGYFFDPASQEPSNEPLVIDVDGQDTLTINPPAPKPVESAEPATSKDAVENKPAMTDLKDASQTPEERVKSVLKDPSKFGRRLTPAEIAKLKTKPTEWDTDGDGIQNEADTMPTIPSDAFIAGSTLGRIINTGGHAVRILGSNGGGNSLEASDGVSVEVDKAGGSDAALVEIIGVELELEPGTILEASFG